MAMPRLRAACSSASATSSAPTATAPASIAPDINKAVSCGDTETLSIGCQNEEIWNRNEGKSARLGRGFCGRDDAAAVVFVTAAQTKVNFVGRIS
jgi:hypothetical protein